MTDALRRLVELADREHALAAARETEGLAEVQEGLQAAVAALPPTLAVEERVRLAETFALRQQTIELLRLARDDAAAEMAKLDQGRTAVRGYAPAGHGPRSTVDASG